MKGERKKRNLPGGLKKVSVSVASLTVLLSGHVRLVCAVHFARV